MKTQAPSFEQLMALQAADNAPDQMVVDELPKQPEFNRKTRRLLAKKKPTQKRQQKGSTALLGKLYNKQRTLMSQDKAQVIKDFLEGLDPNLKMDIVPQPNGGVLLQGPFPTFIIMLGIPNQVDGFCVSVNADAPSAVYFMTELNKKFPELANCGPYSEKLDATGLEFDPVQAYTLREQHAVAAAMKIIEKRQVLAAKENEGKIILPGNQEIIVPQA